MDLSCFFLFFLFLDTWFCVNVHEFDSVRPSVHKTISLNDLVVFLFCFFCTKLE